MKSQDHHQKQDKQDNQRHTQNNVKKSIKGYEVLSQLGIGAYGKVYKIKKNGHFYALKLLERQKIIHDCLQKCVENEISVMQQLNSEHCLKIYDNFDYGKWTCMIIEYCNSGTLLQYIVQKKPDEKECMSIFIQMLKGFAAIHEKGFLHRDLKPDNILIQENQNGYKIYKIADFGFATLTEIGKTHCGTSYFMSPEIIMHQQHDHKSDLWSLGVILYFMLFRIFPFRLKNRIREIETQTKPYFDLKKSLKINNIKYEASQELCDLFKHIFVFDKEKRPNFSYMFNNCKQFVKFQNKKDIDDLGTQYSQIEKKKTFIQQNSVMSLTTRTIKIQDPSIGTLIHEEESDDDDIHQNETKEEQTDYFNNQKTISNMSPKQKPQKQPQIPPYKLQLNQIKKKEEDIEDETHVQEGQIQQHQNFRIGLNKETKGVGPKYIDQSEFIGQHLNSFIENNNNNENQHQSQDDLDEIDKTIQLHQLQTSMVKANKLIGIMDGSLNIDSKYQEINKKYIFHIDKYNFISDTLQLLPYLNLEHNIKSVVQYILSKLYLFFATHLKQSLENGQNIFKMQNFDEFISLKYHIQLLDKIKQDLDRWKVKMQIFYQGIDKKKCIVNQTLEQLITEELVETDFNRDLKCQTRKVLDIIFKHAYKIGCHYYQQENLLLNYQDGAKIPSQTSQTNNTNKNESPHNHKNGVIERKSSSKILAVSYSILLCMLINNIFDFQDVKITFQRFFQANPSIKEFDFWKFTNWIQKANQVDLIESIHSIVKYAFGNDILKNLQNSVSTHQGNQNIENHSGIIPNN